MGGEGTDIKNVWFGGESGGCFFKKGFGDATGDNFDFFRIDVEVLR